jgi:hypothetical protein
MLSLGQASALTEDKKVSPTCTSLSHHPDSSGSARWFVC